MKKHDLSSRTLDELITIVEYPENYQEFMAHAASKELKKRNTSKEKIIPIAESLYKNKCKALISENMFQADAFELPYSSLLTKKHSKSIFRSELEAFKNRRNLLNYGLGSYGASGG